MTLSEAPKHVDKLLINRHRNLPDYLCSQFVFIDHAKVGPSFITTSFPTLAPAHLKRGMQKLLGKIDLSIVL